MRYRETAADLIKNGKNVALYCDGMYGDTNILYLDKFFGVHPSVVIDNDPRKKGKILFGIPIMPYAEAKKQFDDIYYYIQGNTYQYAIIGDLLGDGIDASHIINYVPVEKRRGCLIDETSIGISNTGCNICYETGFNYNKNNTSLKFPLPLTVEDFCKKFPKFREQDAFIQQDGTDCRNDCPMYKEGYYAVKPKIRMIGDYNSDYCALSCMYCFLQELGMNDKPREIQFHEWLSMLLQSDCISDALVLHLCPTEKIVDGDIDRTLEICKEHIDAFETIQLFSCCYAYRKGLEPLLEMGMAKSIWSLDAGTEATYERIKRKTGIFKTVLDNVENYYSHDAFGGASIVPKYSIMKGINDNEQDFEGFLDICRRFHVMYCGIQWDYADNDNESKEDYDIVRKFYRMIRSSGIKTTYTSGSTFLSKALEGLVFYENLVEG